MDLEYWIGVKIILLYNIEILVPTGIPIFWERCSHCPVGGEVQWVALGQN